MWGQGLRPENKSWYQIKLWLAQNTGRAVVEKIEAHSGAVIDSERTDQSRVSINGEVNSPIPTLIDQLERVRGYFTDGSQVDLVLVSGCVNDVGARTVLNAAISSQEIGRLAEAKCGPLMGDFLRRVRFSFPTAYVIVVGYYPFVSEKTRNDIFMRALTKRFYKAAPGASRLSRELIFKQMVANSDEWYRSSNKTLSDTVDRVNSEIPSNGSKQRVMFAEVHLLPENSFRAPKTRLWNFESCPLRKLLVILSFGKILLRPNDEVRKQRTEGCKEYWKARPDETPSQKRERKNEELLCRYAALGHPNRQGALIYTQAILDQLRITLSELESK
jgi:hypothetical protein